MKKIITTVTILIAGAGMSFLGAQPEPGEKVCILTDEYESGEVTGTVSEFSDSSITIRTDHGLSSYRLNSVQRIDVSTGQKRYTGTGAIIGVLAGGLVTGLIASKNIKVRKVSNAGNSNKEHDSCREDDSDYNSGFPGDCDFFPDLNPFDDLENPLDTRGVSKLEKGVRVAAWTTAGALAGSITGALIGRVIKRDKWKRSSFDVSFGVIPPSSDEFALNPRLSLRIPLNGR